MRNEMDVTGMTLEELDREATWLAGHLTAAEARLVAIVGELDRREEWLGDGVASPAHWLTWRTGLSPGAARERVRVARALRDLPVLSAAFADGRISYSKVRATTRVATAETDQLWTDFARSAPAAQIERLAREQARQDSLTPGGTADVHARRRLSWRWDDDGSLLLSARLPPLDGAAVLQALRAALDDHHDSATDRDQDDTDVPAETPPPRHDATSTNHDEPDTDVPAETPPPDHTTTTTHADPADTRAAAGPPLTAEQIAFRAERALNLHSVPQPDQTVTTHDEPDERTAAARADALVAICDAALAGTRIGRTGADRYRVIVHTYRGTQGEGQLSRQPHLDDGPPVSKALLALLACDAARTTVTHDTETDEILTLGRTTREPSTGQRRALALRDRHCQGPGCDRTRHVHAHHWQWWSHDGPTDLDNLLLLCTFHHALVHVHHWNVTRDTDGGVHWTRPDGSLHDPTVTLAGGDTDTLAVDHLHHGHPIDHTTIETDWDGRPLTRHIVDNCLAALADA